MDDTNLTPVGKPSPTASTSGEDDPDFRSLKQLLWGEGHSLGVLASAIEAQGVQGWDQFFTHCLAKALQSTGRQMRLDSQKIASALHT